MNSSNPMRLADRTWLLASVMLPRPAAVAAGKSGSTILQTSHGVEHSAAVLPQLSVDVETPVGLSAPVSKSGADGLKSPADSKNNVWP